MLNKFDSLGRWSRRHGLKLAQLALLAWIALELHGINQQAATAVDPGDVAEIADRLDDIVDAMHGQQSSAGTDKIALPLQAHPRSDRDAARESQRKL
jgi:hypothetical protein